MQDSALRQPVLFIRAACELLTSLNLGATAASVVLLRSFLVRERGAVLHVADAHPCSKYRLVSSEHQRRNLCSAKSLGGSERV